MATDQVTIANKRIGRYGRRGFWGTLWNQRALMLMSIPLLIYKFIFSYVPLSGWVMAFQDYKLGIRSMFQQEWVGLANFKSLFSGYMGELFLGVLKNTLGQSILTLVLGYICAIILSLLLNELRHLGFKRVIQNVVYMPHFLSWIIVAGLVGGALAGDGIINEILVTLHIIDSPIIFLNDPKYFWGVVAGSNLWKELGWNTIIYMAAMTAIDGSLYEAASIDGANRFHKMWHITLPSIKPTIVILMLMSLGRILESGFDLQYILGNGLVRSASDNIDIFVLRYGINEFEYSLATAAGMFKTVVSIALVAMANFTAGKLGEEKLM